MERSSQPPNTECCRQEGQVGAALEAAWPNDRAEAYTGKIMGRKQDTHPAKAIQPRDGTDKQVGTKFPYTEPNMIRTAEGEERINLPGSKSVAREERTARNLGERPADSRRTNCESQAGKETSQRQEVASEEKQAVRSAHSNQPPPQPVGAAKDEGADRIAQAAKETRAVRKTEALWRTSLQAIARKAKQQKKHRFGGIYRLINEEALRDCYLQLRKDAACGVDEVSWKEYGKNLNENLAELNQRLKQKSYHAKLVRRKYIPKGEGKFRPLGILTLEDKVVQMAAARILNAIYEADFLPSSWGYRPGRNAQAASRELAAALTRGRYEFVVEADIKGYFEHINWEWLLKMLNHRIDDGAFLGLICKWLKAGILEGAANFTAWIRENRHEKLPRLLKGLASKYRGTWNYYGVRGNSRSLEQYWQQTRKILFKWLNRRSQKRSYTQRAFKRLLKRFCIPTPSIKECAPLANEPNPAAAEAALNQLFRRNDAPKACA